MRDFKSSKDKDLRFLSPTLVNQEKQKYIKEYEDLINERINCSSLARNLSFINNIKVDREVFSPNTGESFVLSLKIPEKIQKFISSKSEKTDKFSIPRTHSGAVYFTKFITDGSCSSGSSVIEGEVDFRLNYLKDNNKSSKNFVDNRLRNLTKGFVEEEDELFFNLLTIAASNNNIVKVDNKNNNDFLISTITKISEELESKGKNLTHLLVSHEILAEMRSEVYSDLDLNGGDSTN